MCTGALLLSGMLEAWNPNQQNPADRRQLLSTAMSVAAQPARSLRHTQTAPGRQSTEIKLLLLSLRLLLQWHVVMHPRAVGDGL